MGVDGSPPDSSRQQLMQRVAAELDTSSPLIGRPLSRGREEFNGSVNNAVSSPLQRLYIRSLRRAEFDR